MRAALGCACDHSGVGFTRHRHWLLSFLCRLCFPCLGVRHAGLGCILDASDVAAEPDLLQSFCLSRKSLWRVTRQVSGPFLELYASENLAFCALGTRTRSVLFSGPVRAPTGFSLESPWGWKGLPQLPGWLLGSQKCPLASPAAPGDRGRLSPSLPGLWAGWRGVPFRPSAGRGGLSLFLAPHPSC